MGFNDILKNYSETNRNATCAKYSRMSTGFWPNMQNRIFGQRRTASPSYRHTGTDTRKRCPGKARIAEIKDNIESVEYDERENMWEEVDKIEKTILDKYEKALDDALPQVFALVKATAKRFAENEK